MIDKLIVKLNDFIVPYQLRRYQLHIATNEIVVFEEDTFHFLGSWCTWNGHVIYIALFRNQRLAFLAHRVKDGYPLVLCASLNDCEVQWSDGRKSTISMIDEFVREIKKNQHLINQVEIDLTSPSEPLLLVGHNNFAHLLWNQLGALHALSKILGEKKLSYIELNSPMGPLETIIKWFGNFGSKRDRTVINREYRPKLLMFRAGGKQVTSEVAELVYSASLNFLHSNESGCRDYFKYLSESKSKRVLWISVRRDKRTCLNFYEVFSEIIKMISDVFPDKYYILFDGFSRQHIKTPEKPGHEARILSSQGLIESLLKDCSKAGIPAMNLNGRDLYECIVYARSADIYITHVGTLQHKVAWFSTAKGLVHMPPTRNASRQVKWLSEMKEAGEPPNVIPSVRRLPGKGMVPKGKDADYYIDLSESVRCIIMKALSNDG